MEFQENLIYLFDESGKAILSPNDPHIFLGVGVIYNENDEKHFYNSCNELFGLSTTEPLKNENITEKMAKRIAKKIVELNITVVCVWIDLDNENLISILENYRNLTIELKRYHRRPGSRKIAHILHDKIIDKNIFEILDFLSDVRNVKIRLKPFIDMWSIPKLEKNIKLTYRSHSIEQKISEITNRFNQNIVFKVDDFQLLEDQKDKRKRFIDVITSATSRSFKKVDKTKYICDQLIIFPTNRTIKFIDYTQEIIEHINMITDNFLKDNPVI